MPITTRRTLEPSAAIDESYRYQPLNTDRPAFRLLRLRKGYWTPIECDILHESLDQPTQPYEALSYTWGNPDRNQRISVNGSTLAITSSLLWTLIHLRYKDEDRILWIDGICIDQTNLVERGHQVQQMGDIYRSAERVIFWLGRATDQIAILMHSIQLFEEESNSHECSDWKLNDPRWATLWEKVQSKLQVRYQELLWTQERGLKTFKRTFGPDLLRYKYCLVASFRTHASTSRYPD
ncbi:HET-domain-containing protein [Colletotrichum karsti]|uniref:HET-domain-containing protein n=1 Tax=Colletotrichum karsti TaxID=1095194 RepID=A0A9P6I7G9_9PEZI|nr:HET-domain-containing protein [Colletotrichum karsti]KAF9877389.1 HET-domain-containing protein [Colletotrichum karsti]